MSEPVWRRPKHCSANECIEVRVWPKAVEIRSAKMSFDVGGWVFASPEEWAAFVAGIKAGDFDDA